MSFRLFITLILLTLHLNGALAVQTPHENARTPSCRSFLLRNPDNQIARDNFIAQYADNIYVTETENQIWIERSFLDKSSDRFYAVTENAWLKRLNDNILKDKDLVTALTNYHKELVLKHLKLKQLPFKVLTYSDFKSLRFEIEQPVNESVVRHFETAFRKAGTEFFSSAKVKSIVREKDLQPFWFTLGLGDTADEASLAAREARQASNPQDLIRHFWDVSLQEKLESQRLKIIETHQYLMSSLTGTALVDEQKQEIVLDVFTHARKATTPEGLLTSLQLEFPDTPVNEDIADVILKYIQAVDEFSPSMLIAKRELLSIHDAPFGAISIDFIGLGAENIKSTAAALILSKNLSNAIKRTRTAERKVTRSFIHRKHQVEKIVTQFYRGQVSVRFSGDDGVIIPFVELQLRDQLSLVHQLSQVMPYPYFRMTSINASGANSSQSSELISHGESIEKTLRSLLLKSLGRSLSKKIHIHIFNPDITDQRDVFLLLNIGIAINPKISTAIQSDFHTAVNMLQAQLSRNGSSIVYSPSSIFTVRPETINTLPKHWNSGE